VLLLTGATGFTGGYVVELLLDEGYEVTALVRESSDTAKLDRLGVRKVVGDLRDDASVSQALDGADTLVNVASMAGERAARLVRACRERGVSRAVFFSSTSIFTALDSPVKPRKIAAEKTIRQSGLDFTVLRPTMIYGTHADRNMCRLVAYLARHRVIPVIGDGKSLQQPVHVEDLARAVVLALRVPASIGRFYDLPGAEALTYNEVIDTTARILGRRVTKLHLPLGLCAAALATARRVTGRSFLSREQALRLNEDKAFSIEKARSELGYRARTFEEGMRSEVDEMRSLGVI